MNSNDQRSTVNSDGQRSTVNSKFREKKNLKSNQIKSNERKKKF